MTKEQSPTVDASSEASAEAPPRALAARVAAKGRHTTDELDRLMDRYADGDEAAFRELHRQIAPRLGMFLLRLCGKARLAEDLLQDTFLRIHRARGGFTRGATAVPWIYAVARNVFIDHARKGGERVATCIEELPDGAQPTASPGSAPDAELVAKEALEIVRATLAKLPVTHRDAFVLLRFEGLSVAEAAQILDTSEANVKVRAFRAYEAFRSALNGPAEET